MKKLNLGITALVLFFPISVFSQVGQRSVMLGGTAKFDIQFRDPDNSTGIYLYPDIGYYVTDNVAIGGQLGIGHIKHGDLSTLSFGIAPFVRLDIGLEGTFRCFVKVMGGYETFKSKDNNYEVTLNGATFSGGPGVAIFLNDNVAIEGILEYVKRTGDFDSSNLRLFIGIQAYLSGK